MLETKFKRELIRELRRLYPGCIITRMDPTETQGLPDILILYKDRWAVLEGKAYADAPVRPNQPYYVNKMNDMSFAAFIYPENKEDIMDELQRALLDNRR